MKQRFAILLFLGITQSQFAQKIPFSDGEFFKFKMSYSGFLRAGTATLEVEETYLNDKEVFHVTGKGWTTGMIKLFFNVEDRYESYFTKDVIRPVKFIRKINEGGHVKDMEIDFSETKATVNNLKNKTTQQFDIPFQVQDMVSTYYYFRNAINIKKIKEGQEFTTNMFFDNENFVFKLKYLGEEVIKTDFGKVTALKFRPYVMAGRVFKEEESLTLWVSKDENKIPLQIIANLAVGSLRAELEEYKSLKYTFRAKK